MRAAPFVEPDASGGVLGPSLAGKQPKTDQHFNYDFSFLLRPLVSLPACLVDPEPFHGLCFWFRPRLAESLVL